MSSARKRVSIQKLQEKLMFCMKMVKFPISSYAIPSKGSNDTLTDTVGNQHKVTLHQMQLGRSFLPFKLYCQACRNPDFSN